VNRYHSVAVAAIVIVAAGFANADKFGGNKTPTTRGDVAHTREMPANDDFNTITFRAGAGGSSPGCCPADLDCNGIIDASDLASVLGAWGSCIGCPADLDASGVVDASDLAIILSGWGPCAG